MKKAVPFLISSVITAAIMTSLSFFINDPFQAKGTLVSGLIAAIVIATIPIYDIDKWPLKKRSLIHFLIMLVTVLPLLFYSGWFSPLMTVGAFLLFGLVGWTIGFIVNKFQK